MSVCVCAGRCEKLLEKIEMGEAAECSRREGLGSIPAARVHTMQQQA
jgi:hypothetical protein